VTITREILGMCIPGNAPAVLYRSPEGESTVVAGVNICNRNAGARTVRLWVALAGDKAPPDAGMLLGDSALAANTSMVYRFGGTLGPGQQVFCQASTTDVSFQAFGERSDE
jgi:hypothetical protein